MEVSQISFKRGCPYMAQVVGVDTVVLASDIGLRLSDAAHEGCR